MSSKYIKTLMPLLRIAAIIGFMILGNARRRTKTEKKTLEGKKFAIPEKKIGIPENNGISGPKNMHL